MTDALFQTPAPEVAPVASGVGTTPAALGAVDALPVAPDLGDGSGAGRATLCGEAQQAGPVLRIHVVGLPAPQGSKRAFRNPHNNSVQMVESASAKLKPWRQDVKQAALDALPSGWTPLGDLELHVTFLLPRPRGHYRTGRNAHLLRDSAPARPTTKPDVDKLLRSTLDALKVAQVYLDDANVTTVTASKAYATHHTGALIAVYRPESA